VAAILGVVGAFILSSGLVLLSQGSAQSAAVKNVKVEVCHATNSDSHPYNDLSVNENAGGAGAIGGHLAHRTTPVMTWKSDGVWNGMVHHAGDPKRDYIHSYTDANGTFHDFGDDAFFARGGCGAAVLTLVTPGVTWIDPDCTTAAGFVGADTAHIDYTITAGALGDNSSVTVTATPKPGSSFGGPASKDYSHTFSFDRSKCTVTTVTPDVTWIDATCAHGAGFTGANTANIDYAVTAGTVGPGNTVTVTATAHVGFEFSPGVTTKDFTHTFNSFNPATCRGGGGSSGGGGTPPPPPPPPSNPPPSVLPPTVVTVADPSFDDPSCSDPNGAAVRLPGTNAPRANPAGPITLTSVLNGVKYVATGTLGALGTVTVTATPTGTNVLAPGSTTTWTHTFAAVSCPNVVSPPAQVPTFVESGLDPQATTVTVVPTGRLRAWGIALTTVGGMVVAGAFWLGLGRRRRGVAV
jgi:hypothetical protein